LSPSPEHVEYAEMLLRRAKGDARVCRALTDDTEIDDSAVGFHAQQAVEKALKIALVLAEVELPRTHDLELVEQLKASGPTFPVSFQVSSG
jgi:HEPN domain-containing protein